MSPNRRLRRLALWAFAAVILVVAGGLFFADETEVPDWLSGTAVGLAAAVLILGTISDDELNDPQRRETVKDAVGVFTLTSAAIAVSAAQDDYWASVGGMAAGLLLAVSMGLAGNVKKVKRGAAGDQVVDMTAEADGSR